MRRGFRGPRGRGPPRGPSRGTSTTRGRGDRKRPAPHQEHPQGPPVKIGRGRGQSRPPRDPWQRGQSDSESRYAPPSANFDQQEPGPSYFDNSRHHHFDDNNYYPEPQQEQQRQRQHQPFGPSTSSRSIDYSNESYDRGGENRSMMMAAPMSSSSSRQSNLPKPIPSMGSNISTTMMREHHSPTPKREYPPHISHGQGGGPLPTPRSRMRSNSPHRSRPYQGGSHSSSYQNHNHHRTPTPPPPQDYSYQYNTDDIRRHPEYKKRESSHPPKGVVGGESMRSRGRGRANLRGGTSVRGSAGPRPGSSTTFSPRGGGGRTNLAERLGPKVKVADRLGGRGHGRGRGVAAPKHHDANNITDDYSTTTTTKTTHEMSNQEPQRPSTSFDSDRQLKNRTQRYVYEKEDGTLHIECRICGYKNSSWTEYKSHFLLSKHMVATKSLKGKLSSLLLNIRSAQRKKENEISKQILQGSWTDEHGKKKPSLFCKLCKLIFNSSREEHENSRFHEKIVELIHPKCQTCNKSFPTPMSYEKHLSTLKHLKTVLEPNKTVADDADDEDEPPEDVENWETLDEIQGSDDEAAGEVDRSTMVEEKDVSMEVEDTRLGEDFDKNSSKDQSIEELESIRLAQELHEMDDNKMKIKREKLSPEKEQQEDEVKISLSEAATKAEVKPEIIEIETTKIKTEPNLDLPEIKPEVPVGSDYVRQLVMYYCDLCHKYLPKLNRGDPDELVNNHCISPGHQNAFVKIEAEKRLEEHKALKQLEREESQSPAGPIKSRKDKVSFNEDQLDYEVESTNGDVKSETSEK